MRDKHPFDLPAPQPLEEAIDDLKACHLEAASAFPDPGSRKTRKPWFRDEAKFAKTLPELQPSSRPAPSPGTGFSPT